MRVVSTIMPTYGFSYKITTTVEPLYDITFYNNEPASPFGTRRPDEQYDRLL
jgi:hypothetical protein